MADSGVGQGSGRDTTSPNWPEEQFASTGWAASPNPAAWAFQVGYPQPCAEVSTPLGAHLPSAMKEKN